MRRAGGAKGVAIATALVAVVLPGHRIDAQRMPRLQTPAPAWDSSQTDPLRRLLVPALDGPRATDSPTTRVLAPRASALAPPSDVARIAPAAPPARATTSVIPGDRPAVWQQRYSRPSVSFEEASDIAVDKGRVFTAGYGMGAESGYDALVSAHDAATGLELWRTRIDGEAHDYDQASAVVARGGRVFVTGYSWNRTRFEMLTIAFDAATGAELWRAVRPSALWEGAFAATLSPDGSRLYVGGISYAAATAAGQNATGAGSALVVAYDTALGLELWSARTAGSLVAGVLAIAASDDGSTVVAGGTAVTARTDTDAFVMAIDAATGVPVWQRLSDTSGDDYGGSIALHGPVVYAGESATGSNGWLDFRTRAIDARTGDVLWSRSHNGVTGTGDVITGAGVAPDGTAVYVAGVTGNGGGGDTFTVLAYAAEDGERLWIDDYRPGGGPGQARDLIVRDDGSVVVTGFVDARDGSGRDAATVTYAAADGSRVHVERFDEGPNDDGIAIESDDAGGVFVAAESWGSTTQRDLVVSRAGGWTRRYHGPGRQGFDATYESVLSNDGATLFHAGLSTANGLRIATRAIEVADGTQRWEASYDLQSDTDPSFSGDLVGGIAVDLASDRVFVTGGQRVVERRANGDLYRTGWGTVAYDAETGVQLWTANRQWPQERGAYGAHVLVSPDGATVYIVGGAAKLQGSGSVVVVDARDAATGALRWSVRVGEGDEQPGGAALSADGSTLFLGGRAWNGIRGDRYYVSARAISTADGTQRWKSAHGGGFGFFTSVVGVEVTPSGRVLVGASLEEEDPQAFDTLAVAFDAETGAELWADRHRPAEGFAEAIATALTPDGSTFVLSGREIGAVAAGTGNVVAGNDALTIAYDVARGARRWTATFDSGAAPSPRPLPEDIPFDAAVSGDGASVVIAGMLFDVSSDWAGFVVVYDLITGVARWSTRLDGSPGEDGAFTVDTSLDGTRAYVGGAGVWPATWVDATAYAFDLR